jgi:hypothetical protein
LSVAECPNCGAPMRDGHCNYCQASELAKNVWNDGKCRNCGAGLHNNLVRDKQNQFVCRYCGWPVRDKPVEDTLKPTPSTPPDPDPLPPNSPARHISSSNFGSESFGFDLILLPFILIVAVLLLPVMMNMITQTSGNITTTNHPIDIPVYYPGASVILIGGVFVAGVILTFVILRVRHRRELRRLVKQ